MTLQTITLRMPATLYRQVEQRARKAHRPVEDELVDVVTAALPTVEDLPVDIAGDLAQLAYLADAELQQASQTALPFRDVERMQALLLKRQREGLKPQETREAERLLHRADRTMLVRAQATVLLKARVANAMSSQPMAGV